MTCPDRPTDLDLLLIGAPVDASVRDHAEACTVCAEEVALDAEITAALRARRTVTAPAGLAAAAIAQARAQAEAPAPRSRRAPAASRPAVRRARPLYLRTAGVALAALLGLAMLWSLRPDAPAVPAGPTTADATDRQPADPTPEPEPLPVAQETEDEPDTPAPDVTAPIAAPPPAPTRREAPPADRPDPAPTPQPEDVPSENLAQATPGDSPPTPEEVAQAEAELKLAFALVDNAQQRARRAVREEASSIPTALNHVIPFAP
ncbi:MAG TPA: hypothetical protein EYQ24_10340 [Bacteroidetes bacterium]|nr:hypothetical protein [Bacteroidota bacterium]HIL56562.1 hypothetical protein [Rhodothermales bacterium]